MDHGGADNGRLPCTYSDFVTRGPLRRASISFAVRQCVELGFVEVTYKGGRAISEVRKPSLYRLTYVIGRGRSSPPTHDWRHIKTDEEARAAVARAAARRNYDTQPLNKLKNTGLKEEPGAGRTIESEAA